MAGCEQLLQLAARLEDQRSGAKPGEASSDLRISDAVVRPASEPRVALARASSRASSSNAMELDEDVDGIPVDLSAPATAQAQTTLPEESGLAQSKVRTLDGPSPAWEPVGTDDDIVVLAGPSLRGSPPHISEVIEASIHVVFPRAWAHVLSRSRSCRRAQLRKQVGSAQRLKNLRGSPAVCVSPNRTPLASAGLFRLRRPDKVPPRAGRSPISLLSLPLCEV